MDMDPAQKIRDVTGNVHIDPLERNSYEAQRHQELRKERELFNVSYLGLFMGGLPQKKKGRVRGSAIFPPSNFHLPYVHNALMRDMHPDTTVDVWDAAQHNLWENSIYSQYYNF